MGEVELLTAKLTPFGQRVQVALTEKKTPFKITRVGLSNKSQALPDENPLQKKIPAIIHNGKPVAEYLEDEFPGNVSFMPKDADERSQVRFWADNIYKVFTIMQDTFMIKPGTPEKQAASEATLSSVATFESRFESAMNGFSAEGPFFTGLKFGRCSL